MSSADRRLSRATRWSRATLLSIGDDFREARLGGGLSLREVARRVGIAHSHLSRIERGLVPNVSLALLARIAAILGLRLFLRAYPEDRPVRDAAHARLIRRFVGRLDPGLRWRGEVPLPLPGDPRAWDGALDGTGVVTRAEFETRLHDGQALLRRIELKRRDDPSVERVILVLADTRSNRIALRALGAALTSRFPLDGEAILAALAEGRDPGGDGIVLI